ncbi:MAG: hypothetical protein ACK526_07340 [Planctomyces sp.]|jgi:hypothetical protein
MHRRRTLASLVSMAITLPATLATRSRTAAEELSSRFRMNLERIADERTSTTTTDTKADHRRHLMESLQHCLEWCARAQVRREFYSGGQQQELRAALIETESLCRFAIQQIRSTDSAAPAFWQCCSDACQRCAVLCASSETTEPVEHTSRLCGRMVTCAV